MHESLMVLNRTLALEMLCMLCLMEMSCFVDFRNTSSHGNFTHGKNISAKEFIKLHMKYSVVPRMSTSIKMKL